MKLAGAGGVAGLFLAGLALSGTTRADDALIKYNGNAKDYWEHPPADWFMGDETVQQHGQHPYPGQPTPTPGIKPNVHTTSALEKDVSAAEARTRCSWLSPSLARRSAVTETATKSRPTSAPATPAAATKKSWKLSRVRCARPSRTSP